MEPIGPHVTHPETAWLVHAVPPALTAAALLGGALLLRGRLPLLLAQLAARRARRALGRLPTPLRPDPALVWAPEPVAPAALLGLGLALALALAVALTLTLPPAAALALGAPLAAAGAWLLDGAARRRYVAALERDLTGAVGRLSALLRGGTGLRQALERVAGDLEPGPLRAEWAFLVGGQGLPLDGGGIATPQQVFLALAAQTPSRRHATLLNHLGACVGQPQDVLARRCEAAYAALQASERRRDEAATELAQVRYSGMAVGMAGVGMALYLVWSQWERVALAYSTPLGAIVGAVVLLALCLPIAGGALLARVEDADY